MNNFNLRFRRKKLFAVLGLALGLLAMPLLQSSQAASNVIIDSTFSSRVYSGPGGATDFADSTTVQHGNVVQFGILVHNAEDALSGPAAKNFKVRVTIPDGPTTQAISTETISADNGTSPAPYRQTDTTTLNSANGQPFTITGLRNLQLQRNNVAPTNNPTFNWGAAENIPFDRMQIERVGNSTVVTITPNANGDLGPCFQNALRLIFLADITQPLPFPHLSLKKQVRHLGETAWVDQNTAKAGDTLEYLLTYTNDGKAVANNVVIRDSLPPTVTFVPGSGRMTSSSDPTSKPIPDAIVAQGVDVGNFLPGAIGKIRIQAKVNDQPVPATLKNVGIAKSSVTPEVWDTAETVLPGAPTPPPTSTPTPTMTPTPTPTPTVQPQAGGLVIVKFEDKNGNGTQENGEGPLSNVTFTICGPEAADGSDADNASPVPSPTATPEASADAEATDQADASAENCRDEVTNADGKIVLNGLEPGTYTVTEQVPSGFRVTTASTQNVTVVNNSTVEVKFGNQRLTSPTPTPPITREDKEAPPAEQLPKTGTPLAAALATIGIASSGYLYRRERIKLNEAMNDSNIVS